MMPSNSLEKPNNRPPAVNGKPLRLADLAVGQRAQILHVCPDRAPQADDTIADDHSNGVAHRLLEMGFEEGRHIEIGYTGLFGRDPLAVHIGGALVALRRHDAKHVVVALVEA